MTQRTVRGLMRNRSEIAGRMQATHGDATRQALVSWSPAPPAASPARLDPAMPGPPRHRAAPARAGARPADLRASCR